MLHKLYATSGFEIKCDDSEHLIVIGITVIAGIVVYCSDIIVVVVVGGGGN